MTYTVAVTHDIVICCMPVGDAEKETAFDNEYWTLWMSMSDCTPKPSGCAIRDYVICCAFGHTNVDRTVTHA